MRAIGESPLAEGDCDGGYLSVVGYLDTDIRCYNGGSPMFSRPWARESHREIQRRRATRHRVPCRCGPLIPVKPSQQSPEALEYP